MISTGNDIVALKAINVARTKQPNFYKKIISDTEKALYDQHFSDRVPFEQYIWLAWSIKESVFKYQQRISPDLVLSPVKITVRALIAPIAEHPNFFEGRDFKVGVAYEGTIDFSKHTYYSRSIVTEEFIFSVVNQTNNFENVNWGVKKINSTDADDQSKAVRTFALNMLDTLFPGSDLEIDKNKHYCPVILKNDTEIPVPISLAHHHDWVAYSVAIPQELSFGDK